MRPTAPRAPAMQGGGLTITSRGARCVRSFSPPRRRSDGKRRDWQKTVRTPLPFTTTTHSMEMEKLEIQNDRERNDNRSQPEAEHVADIMARHPLSDFHLSKMRGVSSVSLNRVSRSLPGGAALRRASLEDRRPPCIRRDTITARVKTGSGPDSHPGPSETITAVASSVREPGSRGPKRATVWLQFFVSRRAVDFAPAIVFWTAMTDAPRSQPRQDHHK